ncbi:Protein N-lysine methyltransferase METTL21A, variant 2 [Balamuthia mandrillaris]
MTIVLAKYLEKKSEEGCNELKGKRVLELGSGHSLLGIVSFLLGAREIVITDYPQPSIMELMQHNVDQNLKGKDLSNLSICPLIWGEKDMIDAAKPNYDVILAAELLYDEETIEPLLQTIAELSDRDTKVYMTHQEHGSKASALFLQKVGDHFETVRHIPLSEQHPSFKAENVGFTLLTHKRL